MNRKGFTIIEVLAVIVILGILSTVAVMEVSRYRRVVNEKEQDNLRSTIEECYDNYRKDVLLKGGTPLSTIDSEEENSSEIINKYFGELSYNGNKLTFDGDGDYFKITMYNKGALIKNDFYLSCRVPDNYVTDGVCMVESYLDENDNLMTRCSGDTPTASKDKILCLDIISNDLLINDYDDGNSLCYYFDYDIDDDCPISDEGSGSTTGDEVPAVEGESGDVDG